MMTPSARRVAAAAAIALLAGCDGDKSTGRDVRATPPKAETGKAPVTASFDCAKAASALEKAICADAALAKADRELAAAYRAALDQAPGEWRDRLRATQRGWLVYVQRVCLTRYELAPSCHGVFEDRTRELKRTVHRSGGRSFVTLTSYRAEAREPGDAFADHGPVTWRSSLVQIVDPSPEERRWNAAAAGRLQQEMKETPLIAIDGVAEVDSLAPGFIGASVRTSVARGPGGESFRTGAMPWSLSLGREIALSDVFVDPAAAKDAIARLALEQIQSEEDAPEADLETLRQLVDEPRYWHYRREGVALTFDDDNAFGGAHYAVTLGTTIPWSDLAPYLRKDLPFDPKALRDLD